MYPKTRINARWEYTARLSPWTALLQGNHPPPAIRYVPSALSRNPNRWFAVGESELLGEQLRPRLPADRPAVPPIAMLLPGFSGITELTIETVLPSVVTRLVPVRGG